MDMNITETPLPQNTVDQEGQKDQEIREVRQS